MKKSAVLYVWLRIRTAQRGRAIRVRLTGCQIGSGSRVFSKKTAITIIPSLREKAQKTVGILSSRKQSPLRCSLPLFSPLPLFFPRPRPFQLQRRHHLPPLPTSGLSFPSTHPSRRPASLRQTPCSRSSSSNSPFPHRGPQQWRASSFLHHPFFLCRHHPFHPADRAVSGLRGLHDLHGLRGLHLLLYLPRHLLDPMLWLADRDLLLWPEWTCYYHHLRRHLFLLLHDVLSAALFLALHTSLCFVW
mmetsp:Transcript_38687/g.71493  ORF Transcript_38687/g.71493 Transcript_38687/m.71493 type:complete len:246 (+) Transcript_38687:10-747(+)